MTIFIENENYDLDLHCEYSRCGTFGNPLSVQCMDTKLSTAIQRGFNSYNGDGYSRLECDDQDCCPPFRQSLCPADQTCFVCNISVYVYYGMQSGKHMYVD